MDLFVGFKEDLDQFGKWVHAPSLEETIMLVQGDPGFGKSTLLKRFRVDCKQLGLPVALASGQHLASETTLLSRWAADFRSSGIILGPFEKALKRYEGLLLRLALPLPKTEPQTSHVTQRLLQALLKGTIDSVLATVPGGPLVAELGGMGIEFAVEGHRTVFSAADLDFFHDVPKRLTEIFRASVAAASRRSRVLILVDAYDQMLPLQQEWLGKFAGQLPPNTAIVIAGRNLGSREVGCGPWPANVQSLELKRMAPDSVAELVRRLYRHIARARPGERDVQKVVDFACGVPLFAATATNKWALHPERGPSGAAMQATSDIAHWLCKDVPEKIWPAYEAAAILRHFNADSLAALLDVGSPDAYSLFREVRDWPFVYRSSPRSDCAVHDVFRDALNMTLQRDSPDRYKRLHNRAASYYLQKLREAGVEETYNLTLERLYHLIHSGEKRLALDEASGAIDVAVGYCNRPFADSVVALLEGERLLGSLSRLGRVPPLCHDYHGPLHPTTASRCQAHRKPARCPIARSQDQSPHSQRPRGSPFRVWHLCPAAHSVSH